MTAMYSLPMSTSFAGYAAQSSVYEHCSPRATGLSVKHRREPSEQLGQHGFLIKNWNGKLPEPVDGAKETFGGAK